MDDQLIQNLSEKELVEIIYNYKKYNYPKSLKYAAIDELKQRDLPAEELERLESNAVLERGDDINLSNDENFTFVKLGHSIRIYYIIKFISISLLSFFSILPLFFPFPDNVSILIVYEIIIVQIYLLVEKPFRIIVIFHYENLIRDLFNKEIESHWLKEFFSILVGILFPFYDLKYLVQYRRLINQFYRV